MPAISALPDYEVVRDLLPEALDTHLNRGDALRRIAENPGLIPVAIDPAGSGRIFWADIGDHPLREWQFTYSIQHLAESNGIRTAFTTDFDILDEAVPGADGLYPSGLIFHISRCGSTLLSKALARLDSNVVINQGGPLQRGFWARLTDDFREPLVPSPENLATFRRLVLAMTRPRHADHTASFIKFVSWNIVYLDFIRRAFPDVPLLFLYRDPIEVIASVIRSPTPALLAKGGRQAALLVGDDTADTASMTDIEYLARCFDNHFAVALDGTAAGLSVMNYSSITSDNFPGILSRGLSLHPSDGDLARMREQFKYHSKDDTNARTFQADHAQKSQAIAADDKALITEICGGLFEELDRCGANLFNKDT